MWDLLCNPVSHWIYHHEKHHVYFQTSIYFQKQKNHDWDSAGISVFPNHLGDGMLEWPSIPPPSIIDETQLSSWHPKPCLSTLLCSIPVGAEERLWIIQAKSV